jgi:hypothetical protein
LLSLQAPVQLWDGHFGKSLDPMCDLTLLRQAIVA